MPELRAPVQHGLDGLEEVLVLVVELEVGVAGDAERHVVEDLHAREQPAEVRGDHLLERHEATAVRQRHEPGKDRGDLHPGEALHAALRVPDGDGEVQRQVGDVGEGMRRVDGQRGEHRVHEVLERPLQLGLVGRVEVVPVEEADARLLESGSDVLRERRRLALDERAHLLADDPDRLEGIEPVGGAGPQPRARSAPAAPRRAPRRTRRGSRRRWPGTSPAPAVAVPRPRRGRAPAC